MGLTLGLSTVFFFNMRFKIILFEQVDKKCTLTHHFFSLDK